MLSDLQHTSHWNFVYLVLGYFQFIPTLWYSGFDSFAKMSNFMAMTCTVQSQSFALITTGSMKSHKNQTFPPQLELKETIKNSTRMMFSCHNRVSLYSSWKGGNIVHTYFVVDTSKKRLAEKRMWVALLVEGLHESITAEQREVVASKQSWEDFISPHLCSAGAFLCSTSRLLLSIRPSLSLWRIWQRDCGWWAKWNDWQLTAAVEEQISVSCAALTDISRFTKQSMKLTALHPLLKVQNPALMSRI